MEAGKRFVGFSFNIKEGYIDCPKHGRVKTTYIERPDGTKEWGQCPKCVEEYDKEIERKDSAARMQALEGKWESSNVKRKFFPKTFDDYVASNDSQRKALDLAKRIAFKESNRSLILVGDNGLGKTMLASLAVKERGGFIYKMYEIVMKIKASYKANSPIDEQGILNKLSAAPLLVIDEVGKQFGSESERNWLSYVIDERYEAGRPTILISNLRLMRDCSEEAKSSGNYLERYLGKDSVSRLAECADIVNLDGEDWRRKGA